MKCLSVVSWHNQIPEKRSLKRNRLGPPDVYPQDVKQEEDNLGADRLKKGYQVAVTSYEHESVVWNSKVQKLDRLEETMLRGAQNVMQILNKKMELNANLDKERKRTSRDGVFQNFSHTSGQGVKSKERKDWFTDLARGRSLTVLARRPPFFRKKEDALEYLCDFKVPVVRALWFLKLTAVGQGITNNMSKQKKSTNDQLASEHAALFAKYVKLMLCQMDQSAKLESNLVYTDRWPHFVCICKHAYEDGMIERQEFLMDLCDIFAERFTQRSDTAHFLTSCRLFLSFFSQYIDQITQNLLIARRCAFLVAKRLAMFHLEAEATAGRRLNPSEVFEQMAQCQSQRPVVLSLTGILHAILIDCPGALVWNGFQVAEGRPPPLMHQLCGSPLDLLPCSLGALPAPNGYGNEHISSLVELRLMEVKRRSRAVENRWCLNQSQKAGFGRQMAETVQVCLEILGALDGARHDQPHCIEKIYNLVFSPSSTEKFEHEHAIRVKMMMQWAVSVEREGTHRALIVARVLAVRVNHRKCFKIGDSHIQDILLEYLDTEGPQYGQPHFYEEFRNLMLLFVELQRAGIFSHDAYVKGLITTGEMTDQIPILTLIKQRNEEASSSTGLNVSMDQSVRQNLAQFMDSSNTAVKGDFGCQFGMPPESPNQHPLLGPNVTCHERLLIHLPIPQTDEYRSECNQRLLLLHGIGEQREIAKNELKKLARDITKIWTKRIVAEFSFSKPLETRIKKRTNPDQISEILHRFGCQTYYDQVVVCGWCCDNFIAMVSDFAEGHSSVMPTAEGLDILLGLMEECRNIYGIMEFAEELLDVLVHVETVIQEQRADCLPSNPSSHLAYVLAAYLSHNYYYFIHCENAPEIVNGLYRVVESQLKSPEACLTGWGRSIAVFVLHAKKQLIEADSTHKKMLGSWEVLKRVLPPWKPSAAVSNAKFNARLFPTFLSESKRLFKFTEYRQYVALIDGPDARYSFVISALITAVQCGNDYDRLVELANICGHVSAQVPISTEWCCAIQALCCSCVSGNHGFADLLLSINVEDSRCHWNIATFYMLLAARNCFSMNALFHQLLHTALSSLLKSDSAKADVDADPGVCLALLVLADMVCQNDEPVVLSDAYKGEGGSHKHVSGQADRWILSIGHLYDVGDAIFELLCTICVLADYTRNKLRDQIDDRGDAGFRLENISHLSRAVLMAMCEQDWVTLRVYRFCEETNMDVFNSHRLKKNCLGQQLLRMALRRKCERSIVQELTVCNGNSKKSLIDKLFSVLNIWNMRATYFDLKLMIKEISPEGSSNKHAQQGAIAADALIGEIGKCCRDLFTSSHKNERKIPEMAVGKAFRLKHISNYWLMSPLIHACPKPVNLPSSFPAVTVQAKFLREAAAMLDTGGDNNRERIHQSAWLLSQEPFLNLILTCLKGEDQQRDGLVGSLLKQLLELAMKAKENPVLPYLRKFSLEREGLLLRLSLLGGMFDSVCHQSYCDAGAVLLFQLMLYGVISQERDRFLFESCFDMLSTLLVWSITDPMNAVPVNSQDPDTKYRFASYIGIVKKLRKELNERVLVPELRSLLQFLPISKPCTEIISCEPYGTIPMSPQKLSKGQMGSSPIKTNKQGLQFGEKVKIFSYDMVQNYSSEAAVKRSWNWAMFQAVKLDRSPIPLQKQIHRLIPHTHYNEFVRPTICGMDRPPNLDIYLSPPTMDLSETPVNVHHVSSASSVPTSTSAVTSSVAVSTGSIAMGTSGVMDMQATSTSNISTPQSRTLTFQPGGGQMQIPQNPGVDGMVFPGQGGIMSSVLEMNRNTSSSSPRGSRGGRRKATGTRGQGTQRKKAQRGAAAVAAQVDPVLTQSTSTAMSGQTMMSVGAGTSTGPYNWTGQPQPQTQMQPFAPNQQGGGMMVQPEDSKMKIHSMILKRQAQAASVTSAQGYQQINSSSGGQYAQMVVKMESGNMSMETQQSFQDQQAAQFSNQQRQYGMQQSTANVFESRQMMMGQQQQQVPYNQQQYPPF